jgi:hypothetical protein
MISEAFLQHATAGLTIAGLVASPCYAADRSSGEEFGRHL